VERSCVGHTGIINGKAKSGVLAGFELTSRILGTFRMGCCWVERSVMAAPVAAAFPRIKRLHRARTSDSGAGIYNEARMRCGDQEQSAVPRNLLFAQRYSRFNCPEIGTFESRPTNLSKTPVMIL
jgi:hypothetical protein